MVSDIEIVELCLMRQHDIGWCLRLLLDKEDAQLQRSILNSASEEDINAEVLELQSFCNLVGMSSIQRAIFWCVCERQILRLDEPAYCHPMLGGDPAAIAQGIVDDLTQEVCELRLLTIIMKHISEFELHGEVRNSTLYCLPLVFFGKVLQVAAPTTRGSQYVGYPGGDWFLALPEGG